MSKRPQRRLILEGLDTRDLPASFGIPWADPAHLTISFAPDGASASGISSTLFATLDALMPRDVWQGTIRQAAQMWANAAGIGIGLTADGGQAFGVAGETQLDPRFGDIRFGALPMADDSLGQAIPPDPLLTGTYAGDIFFNSTVAFTPQTLLSVSLHEIGHALGLSPSTNPNSVMFNTYGDRTVLSTSDIVAARTLYGTRLTDPSESAAAFRLENPPSYDGATPLVAFGALSARADVDRFRVRNLPGYDGPITVRLQTAGLSFVMPQLSLYDYRNKLIARVAGTAQDGAVVTFTIPDTLPGRDYLLRVEDAPTSVADIGRYALAVTFDDRLGPVTLPLETVLRGPYDLIEPEDLAELFIDPQGALYNDSGDDDNGLDDNTDAAIDLKIPKGPLAFSRFTATGSVEDVDDVDYFRIRAPRSGDRDDLVLTATVRAIGPAGITPTLEVFDRDENPLPFEVLVNGAGRYTVQVPGAESGRRYFLRINGSDDGNFALDAMFRRVGFQLTNFSSGTATQAQPTTFKVYIATTQLFGFALSATGPAGSSIRFAIANEQGNTVFELIAPAGATVTDLSKFLAPGEYTATMTASGTTEPVGFTLRGTVASDPLGPQRPNTSLAPKYQDPNNPGQFLYPGDRVSFDPYLWVLWLI